MEGRKLMTQATYYSKELKAYNELKESLHDLWAEMESGKVTLKQAHSSITSLDAWLSEWKKKPDDDDWNVNQKPKCEDEVFAIDDCTPHQYEEMREHVGSIFAKMWERELTMTEVRGYLKLYQLKAKDTIKEANVQRKLADKRRRENDNG